MDLKLGPSPLRAQEDEENYWMIFKICVVPPNSMDQMSS
jgi:hypothetical protein